MHVLLVNTLDYEGGAARAAFRLNKGLQGIGVDARMLVQHKTLDDRSVVGPVGKCCKVLSKRRPLLDALPLRLYPRRKSDFFSAAFLPELLASRVTEIAPDVIHLHWIGGGHVRLETLQHLHRPLIWTLHDSWAFTGGCHVPYDCTRYRQSCGRCPVLGSAKDLDLSRRVWNRKNKAWQGLDLTVVTPSKWLAGCAKASSLFHEIRVEVIPNGLDLKHFKPVDKAFARTVLSLPKGKRLILFGAMCGTSDVNKGFHLLVPALRRLAANGWSDQLEVVVFGSCEPESPPDFGLKTHYLGRFHDETSLNLLYSAADLFVAPSIQENLPNTVMEALACGTPCVAFDIGGMPDMIDHLQNGYLAKPFDSMDLAEGIKWTLSDVSRLDSLSYAARLKVEKEFDIEIVARRYERLYDEILTTCSSLKRRKDQDSQSRKE